MSITNVLIEDNVLGYKITPQVEKHIITNGLDYTVYTNQYSCRDNTIHRLNIDKVDTFICGCSFSFGSGVEYDKTFGGLLNGNGFNVLNISVPGYSLLQCLMNIELNTKSIKPKIIIIAYGDWLVDRCLANKALGGRFRRPMLLNYSMTVEESSMFINIEGLLHFFIERIDKFCSINDIKMYIYKYSTLGNQKTNYALYDTDNIKIIHSKLMLEDGDILNDGVHASEQHHKKIANELIERIPQ